MAPPHHENEQGPTNGSAQNIPPYTRSNSHTSVPVAPRYEPYRSPETERQDEYNQYTQKPSDSSAGADDQPRRNPNVSENWTNVEEHPENMAEKHTHSQSIRRKKKLDFADGDKSAITKAWYKLLNNSVVLRWIVYIIPVAFLLWIPGIVNLTAAPNAKLLSVDLVWWSSWFTVVWAGWWAARLFAHVAPVVLRNTLGVVAPGMKHYIAFLQPTKKYVTFLGWSIAIYVSFQPLIYNRTDATQDNEHGDGRDLYYFSRGLLGVMISAIILMVEKLLIQMIATNFHKTSYQDRIATQKGQINHLVNLYINSRNIGRSDTLDNARPTNSRSNSANAAVLLKNVVKGVKSTAQNTATALGSIASEMSGEHVVQPNSPSSMVVNAISSANKSRQLARRLYFSFVPRNENAMRIEHIAPFYSSYGDAVSAFEIFDRDGNGDATFEEVEMTLLDIHRERMALKSSMRDLDSAVARLDSILKTVWYIVALIIIIALVSANFTALLASAGTILLGLSWMIAATAQEILASIVFLFVKHAYDVGDRVDIDKDNLVVKEIHLLSTVFRRLDGKVVQMPHTLLNLKPIVNVRRSNAITEDFIFDVDFTTSFEKISELRERMLQFVTAESRDYYPLVDIAIQDFAEQGKLSLAATIRYKSNWQNTSLTILRRNKWVCMLKTVMADLKIFGPGGAGDPNPAVDPQLIKLVSNDEAPPYADGSGRDNDTGAPSAPAADRDERGRSQSEGNQSIVSPLQFTFMDPRSDYQDDGVFEERDVDGNAESHQENEYYSSDPPQLPPIGEGQARRPRRDGGNGGHSTSAEQLRMENVDRDDRPS